MPTGASLVLLASAAAASSAIGTGFQISESIDAKNRAKKATRENEKNANALLSEEQKQSAAQKSAIEAEGDELNRASAKNRQKTLAAGAYGRSDTILTSGLGTQGSAPVAGKTLLGA